MKYLLILPFSTFNKLNFVNSYFSSLRLFIDLLKLGPNSSDALKLKNYRAPTSHGATTSSSRDAGDFAAVLYTVVKDRSYEGEKVTLDELNTKYERD